MPELVVGSSITLELNTVALIIVGEDEAAGNGELIVLSVIKSLLVFSRVKVLSLLHNWVVRIGEIKVTMPEFLISNSSSSRVDVELLGLLINNLMLGEEISVLSH